MDSLAEHSSAAINLLYSGADNVLRSLESAVPADVLSDFMQSVNWREPFVVVLLSMHVLLWLFAIYTRRNDLIQFFLVAMLVGVALYAQRLNDFGKANWKLFAAQDYFDSSGTFLMIFVLVPFLLLTNFIVVRFSTVN